MRFEHDEKYGCYNHSWESGDTFDTFGGESWVDDYYFDEYGIQCDDMSIYNIPAKHFKDLAVQMVNHLMLNGHNFEFYNDDYDIRFRVK